jgi:hypothetical protein
MSYIKKRKIGSENRAFNPEWTNKYLATFRRDKILCLVCRETLSAPKEFYIRRHFEAKHPDLAKLDVSERQIKASNLLKHLSEEQSFFKKIIADNEAATKVSFQISRENAAADKSFTEGEFVKKCLLIAASELCPDKKSVFENITLSRMTVQRRVTDISNNLSNQLSEKAEEFKYYSLAMVESTDSTDTAQMSIFIRGSDKNFAVTEELADLCSMKGRRTGKEMADEVVKCVTEKSGLTFDNLVGVCTDGTPSMRGKNVGAVTLVEKNMLVRR